MPTESAFERAGTHGRKHVSGHRRTSGGTYPQSRNSRCRCSRFASSDASNAAKSSPSTPPAPQLRFTFSQVTSRLDLARWAHRAVVWTLRCPSLPARTAPTSRLTCAVRVRRRALLANQLVDRGDRSRLVAGLKLELPLADGVLGRLEGVLKPILVNGSDRPRGPDVELEPEHLAQRTEPVDRSHPASAQVLDELIAPHGLERGMPRRPAPGTERSVDHRHQIVHLSNFLLITYEGHPARSSQRFTSPGARDGGPTLAERVARRHGRRLDRVSGQCASSNMSFVRNQEFPTSRANG